MKKKRILCTMLALLLLTGCSSKPSHVTETEAPTLPDPSSPQEQIKLLVRQADLWTVPSGEAAETYYYAVTDMDRNGRLEIWAASTQGTGIYTYGTVHEVSADYSDIHECMTPCKEDKDLPEIIMESTPAAFDEDTGCYDYLFTNDTRNGAAEHYQSIVALRLQEGAVSCTTLANSYDHWIDEGQEEHEYAIPSGDSFIQVSAEQYDSAMRDYQADRQGFTANFKWFTLEDGVSEALLSSSWDVFISSFQ